MQCYCVYAFSDTEVYHTPMMAILSFRLTKLFSSVVTGRQVIVNKQHLSCERLLWYKVSPSVDCIYEHSLTHMDFLDSMSLNALRWAQQNNVLSAMFTGYISQTTLVGRNIYYLPLLGALKFKCKFYLSTSAPKPTPDTLLFQDCQNVDKKSVKFAFSNHTDIFLLIFCSFARSLP